MSSKELVCPRCGTPPSPEQHFCGHCGLDLSAQYQLPTRQEWAARQYATASSGALDEPALPGTEADQLTMPPSAAGASTTPAGASTAGASTYPGAPYTTTPGSPGAPVAAALWRGTSRRDGLVAAGGLALAAGAFLATIGSLLTLIDNIHTYVPAGVGVGHGFEFLDGILSIAALAVLAAAFYARDSRRFGRLATGLLVVALAFAANFVARVTLAVEYLTHHVPGTLSAATIIGALAAVPVAIGALLGRATFAAYRAPDPGGGSSRDRGLGVAAAVAAGGTLLLAVSTIVDTVYFSDAGAPGGFTTGLGMQAASAFLLTAAVIVAAVAFLVATGMSVRSSDRVLRRDGLLSVAALVGSVAYLFLFIGWTVATSSGADVILDGKEVAAGWLSAVQGIAWCAGLAAAAVGLFLGRRMRAAPAG